MSSKFSIICVLCSSMVLTACGGSASSPETSSNLSDSSSAIESGSDTGSSVSSGSSSAGSSSSNNALAATTTTTMTTSPQAWRSKLYPANWTPSYKDSNGRFLHDFSYAGYHMGEIDMPATIPGIKIDVTNASNMALAGSKIADKTGVADATSAIQAALDYVGKRGGGQVYLPNGTYSINKQYGKTYGLLIGSSKVVLRGQSTKGTKLYFNRRESRDLTVVEMASEEAVTRKPWTLPKSTPIMLRRTSEAPSQLLYLDTIEGLAVGDWIVVRSDTTADFVADVGMQGKNWENIDGPLEYRRIIAIYPGSTGIKIDIPIRYRLSRSYNSQIYKALPHLEETGLENLSIGMKESIKKGLEEGDWNVPGTAGYEVHNSNAVVVKHVVNGWIRNVATFKPDGNASSHIASNGIMIQMSRNVTVRDSQISYPQYLGGGGNGYGFEVSSNDVLIVKNVALGTRHAYDTKTMACNGSVFYRNESRDSYMVSDAHMWLSHAVLWDNMVMNGDMISLVYRPYGGGTGTGAEHGQSATEMVVWNTYGQAPYKKNTVVVKSQQFGNGYVIGTRGAVSAVENDADIIGAPADWVEGEGKGYSLVPSSLYLDQLDRRLESTPAIVKSIIASDEEPFFDAGNVLDHNRWTRWTAYGSGQWLEMDLGEVITVAKLNMSFYHGDTRKAYFAIKTSRDGTNWQTVFDGESGGTTADYELINVTDSSARFVRYIGYGNSESLWNSVNEIKINP